MSAKFNLFLIGASKSGTTSVWKVLNDSSKIAMCPVKEPCIFSYSDYSEKVKKAFASDWWDREGLDFIGEASPVYSEVLLGPKIPNRIFSHNPEAKIILIVRNPVDRILSVWRQTKNTGHDHREMYMNKTDVSVGLMSRNFSKAIRTYPPFVDASKYWSIYQAYAAVFPEAQIKVLLYEELKRRPGAFYSELFDFLGISCHKNVSVNTKVNVGEGKRSSSGIYWTFKNSVFSRCVKKLFPGLGKMLNPLLSKEIKITEAMRAKVKALVHEELIEESEMILKYCGKDRSYWEL